MRSMLRKYADGYVKWSGKEFIRDRNGSNADVRVRLVALRTIQAVARAGAYATHGNVFHCLSKVADGLESGDLLVDDVSNAKYLLYSGEQHHVGFHFPGVSDNFIDFTFGIAFQTEYFFVGEYFHIFFS